MDELIKDKDVKIARYGSYISKLVEEIKNLKSKYHNLESTTEIPVSEIVTKLSKDNEDLHSKYKKISDELKTGKSSLKKVEDNNAVLAKCIRDLQDKLNIEQNKSSKMEVEKTRMERNTNRLEEIIEINDETKKSPSKKRTVEKCRFFEEHGHCKFDKKCYNLHPTTICEFFLKVGKCPINNCMDLHSQKDCPFWMRGFCKNENCSMKHDQKMKGNSLKRGRSNTRPKNYDDKRSKTSRTEENSTDVYYNRTVEDRLNKQAEQNTFLAKSLAGLSAEVKNLSSHPPQALLQPVGNLAQSSAQTDTSKTPKQTTVN